MKGIKKRCNKRQAVQPLTIIEYFGGNTTFIKRPSLVSICQRLDPFYHKKVWKFPCSWISLVVSTCDAHGHKYMFPHAQISNAKMHPKLAFKNHGDVHVAFDCRTTLPNYLKLHCHNYLWFVEQPQKWGDKRQPFYWLTYKKWKWKK